eukprot:403335490
METMDEKLLDPIFSGQVHQAYFDAILELEKNENPIKNLEIILEFLQSIKSFDFEDLYYQVELDELYLGFLLKKFMISKIARYVILDKEKLDQQLNEAVNKITLKSRLNMEKTIESRRYGRQGTEKQFYLWSLGFDKLGSRTGKDKEWKESLQVGMYIACDFTLPKHRYLAIVLEVQNVKLPSLSHSQDPFTLKFI